MDSAEQAALNALTVEVNHTKASLLDFTSDFRTALKEVGEAVIKLENARAMESSEDVTALIPALVAAQGEFPEITRDVKVKVKMKDNKGEYTFQYASLAAINKAIKPVLAKNGLVLIQDVTNINANIKIISVLYHKSGQFIKSAPLYLEAYNQKDAQGMGGVITYGRRYSINYFLNLSTEPDDDANFAMGQEAKRSAKDDPKPAPRKPAAQKPPKKTEDHPPVLGPDDPIQEAAALAVENMLNMGGYDTDNRKMEKLEIALSLDRNIKKIEDLTKGEGTKIIGILNDEINKK